MPRYTPSEIEPRWQAYWEQNRTFATPESPGPTKRYVLDMFPYPSGEGLHVGHPEGYTATDIVSRFARMKGETVLHPMGFDAFGLPAEEHAIKTGEHPRIQTEKNIAEFTRQLKMLGFSYDWDRAIATTDPGYVRWTQWIFTVLYDTWFDPEQNKGRPISELPIPAEIAAAGETAIETYQAEFRLAYETEAPVNWCDALGTVLANEEVIDGKSERGGHPVRRLPLRQWMLRITAYAERLLSGLENLDWPGGIKTLQQDWIGRSTGAEVDFFIGKETDFADWKKSRAGKPMPTELAEDALRVYTTRPDTLFGATYMVVAPEHPAVDRLTTPAAAADVQKYRDAAAFKSERERTQGEREKTGVFTGSFAINPVNGKPVPIWIADYVMASYGTGAIMAVPAHDERDFEFARQFALPVIAVVDPPADLENREDILAGKACFAGTGLAINSGSFDGQETTQVKATVTQDLETAGLGKSAINYKLRDWLFSRQRFWGEPFPVLHEIDSDGKDTGRKRTVPTGDLPVQLPELADFRPHGRPEPMLEKADQSWLQVELDGKRYRRETNTMPQWAGSCWYFLRYIDPTNDTCLIDPDKERAWMPVDLYVGGAEHAVLHLLYSRFWHKVLFDRGHVHCDEPFQKLINQGMILGEAELTVFQTEAGAYVSPADVRRSEEGPTAPDGSPVHPVSVQDTDVEKQGDNLVLAAEPEIRVESRSFKMSKSRGNVVNPDVVVKEYGADSLRLYEMFMGPLEATKPWSMAGVGGVRNFLDRSWRMIVDKDAEQIELSAAITDKECTEAQNRQLHKTIRSVSEDIESLSFNTAIARMMEFVNFFTREKQRPRAAMQSFVLLLSPFAPHIAEELWEILGNKKTLAYEAWPEWDEAALIETTVEIPVQINGKVRTKLVVAADIKKEDLQAQVMELEKIQEATAGKQIVKTIVVPGRLVNIVVKG
ncbi:Leucine--tRNA ligase [Roseimaritima multifibrata]|uniref:Leucine--tRNA ligase n=1 Tax=Roseimaritima multifibrata TaxID=1930274 RepID=A0A517MDQ2_9BACT|nr:leucine--tRNA ligase [Roseimaritima multifibrata]QDS93012.1 Leucine--tRNA ligase [Roseimaritima multifibrata]